jgi:hypothetical protein
MNYELYKYLEDAEYLPNFMEDKWDNKKVFKLIYDMSQGRENDPLNLMIKDISWLAAYLYVNDMFLWTMALHGYTLQKSRKKLDFEDINSFLGTYEVMIKREKEEEV